MRCLYSDIEFYTFKRENNKLEFDYEIVFQGCFPQNCVLDTLYGIRKFILYNFVYVE